MELAMSGQMAGQAFSGVLTEDGKLLHPGAVAPGYAAERLARVFGTEEDPVNCSWFFKVGACRKGETCPKKHNQPTSSETLLLFGLYQGTPEAIAISNELPWDDQTYDTAQAHVEQFYEDVFLTVAEYGEVEEVVILDNTTPNLFGNVYVKYYHEGSARQGLRGLTGRYYNGRLINAEFTPVADFREARCRTHHEKRCKLVGTCGFMHMKHIPRALKKRAVKAMYHNHPEYIGRRDRPRDDPNNRPPLDLRGETLLPGEREYLDEKGKGKPKGKGKGKAQRPDPKDMTLGDLFYGNGGPTKPARPLGDDEFEDGPSSAYPRGRSARDDYYEADEDPYDPYDEQGMVQRPRRRRRRGEGLELEGGQRRRFRESGMDEFDPEYLEGDDPDALEQRPRRRRRRRDPYIDEFETEEMAAEKAAEAEAERIRLEEERVAAEKKAVEDKAKAVKNAALRTAADMAAAQQLAGSIANAEKAAAARSAARKAAEAKSALEQEALQKAAAQQAMIRAQAASQIEAERKAQAKLVEAERAAERAADLQKRGVIPQAAWKIPEPEPPSESEDEVVLG